VLEDVVAEVGLHGRFEGVSAVVEQTGAFDLKRIYYFWDALIPASGAYL
jgi:hypothetical protein